jgi:triphosphoribosyl-dephospho-CoA synthetase
MNLAEQIEISCLMEATARKPGNVHPVASFVDLDYDDFVCAAQAIGRPLASVQQAGLGQSVWNAIAATQREARSNVNLGIALLIAPLAAVPSNELLQSGIREILATTRSRSMQQFVSPYRGGWEKRIRRMSEIDPRSRSVTQWPWRRNETALPSSIRLTSPTCSGSLVPGWWNLGDGVMN